LTNRSTSHYIRSIKLHKAKILLKTTDLNISQVAYDLDLMIQSIFPVHFLKNLVLRQLNCVNS